MGRVVVKLSGKFEIAQRPKAIEFYDEQELSLLGRNFVIKINEGEGNISKAELSENNLVINLAKNLSDRERSHHISNLVTRSLCLSLTPLMKDYVKGLNERHFNFSFNELKLKNQSSRWGSFSKRSKNISINFRLLFAPQEILDYVIIHELVHIKEPNHSRRFWGLVNSVIPDHKELKRWLNKNGAGIGFNRTS